MKSESRATVRSHDRDEESVTHDEVSVETRYTMVLEEKQPLTAQLMEQVCNRENLNEAYKQVKRNHGAPGVDKMTIVGFMVWAKTNREELMKSLLEGSYEPQPVRAVEIPKPGGGKRMLGIPTVRDRIVQQAILQVIDPIIDPKFADQSYGFRKGRGAHQAIEKSQEYIQAGHRYVVDIDIEKFFDDVNHDMIMARLAKHIKDKRLLKIVRRFLQAGIMQNNKYIEREKGTPQGGPLSPILANLLLNDLDIELNKRNHKFCRYADDCNIYVKSKEAAERVLKSVTQYIQKKLKLRVNEKKSSADEVTQRKFLGYSAGKDDLPIAAKESIKKLKNKYREITKRSRGRKMQEVIEELNKLTIGWASYFKYDRSTRKYRDIDKWIRRKLRCIKLKQSKTTTGIYKTLRKLGATIVNAQAIARSNKGWWRLSGSWIPNAAMSIKYWEEQGLISIEKQIQKVNLG